MKTALSTPIGQSYWNNNGIYQQDLDRLNELIPASGEADTLHGEMIRAINRLYYEYCNNGNINAKNMVSIKDECVCCECGGSGYRGEDECEWCDGNGYITEEYEECGGVDKFFQSLLDYLSVNLKTLIDTAKVNTMIEMVENIITDVDYDYLDTTFGDCNMHIYDTLADHVVWFCLNTENTVR